MRARSRSYGESSTRTRSPGRIRIRKRRILPATCPSTVWPLSSWTRNMAFGSASTTSPSNSTLSSLAMRGAPYRQRPGPPGPNVRRLATDAAVGDRADRGEIRAGVSGSGLRSPRARGRLSTCLCRGALDASHARSAASNGTRCAPPRTPVPGRRAGPAGQCPGEAPPAPSWPPPPPEPDDGEAYWSGGALALPPPLPSPLEPFLVPWSVPPAPVLVSVDVVSADGEGVLVVGLL